MSLSTRRTSSILEMLSPGSRNVEVLSPPPTKKGVIQDVIKSALSQISKQPTNSSLAIKKTSESGLAVPPAFSAFEINECLNFTSVTSLGE